MLKMLHRGQLVSAIVLLTVAGCGGGGGSGSTDTDTGDGGGDTQKTYVCDGTGTVGVSGRIEYEFVPAVSNSAGTLLNYNAAEPRPVRRAEVEARCPDGSVSYATTVTDDAGNYSLEVPESVDVVIRVRASMQSSDVPGWDVQVVDNTRSQAVWSAEGDVIDKEDVSGSITANLFADSGWGGSSYTGARAAGPFAIMDSVYTAMQRVLEAEPTAVFEPLKLNWSPDNKDSCSSSLDQYPFSDGCIGTSFFVNFGTNAGGRNIFILGAEDSDTDEYDNHVVIHEWGHYYEDAFARSDSIGGRHTGGDRLDMRVAFGEGWGNAWSGIATDDPLYVDTYGSSQSMGFSIDVESDSTVYPGWWNETTVQRIIFDLYDAANDDAVALGFGPLHSVLTNEQRNAEAMTSIFPLLHFLKQNNAGSAANIDTLTVANDISTVNDSWGDGRTATDDGSEFDFTQSEKFVTPVHLELAVNHGTSAEVCSTRRFAGGGGSIEYNRLGTRRFVRFNVAASGTWRITLDGSGTSLSDNDPDFFVYLRGALIASATDNSSASATSSPDNPDGGTRAETGSVALNAGETYVLEAMEWLNTDDDPASGGDACLDLSFEAL